MPIWISWELNVTPRQGHAVSGVLCDFRRAWEPDEAMPPPDTDEVIAWREEQRRKVAARPKL